MLLGVSGSRRKQGVLTHNRNVVLIVRMEHGQELLTFAVIEPHWVILEVTIKVHVVDIRPKNISITPKLSRQVLSLPDVVQRNLKLGVIFDNFLNYTPVRIAPSALMKPESKVLLHGWQSCGT